MSKTKLTKSNSNHERLNLYVYISIHNWLNKNAKFPRFPVIYILDKHVKGYQIFHGADALKMSTRHRFHHKTWFLTVPTWRLITYIHIYVWSFRLSNLNLWQSLLHDAKRKNKVQPQIRHDKRRTGYVNRFSHCVYINLMIIPMEYGDKIFFLPLKVRHFALYTLYIQSASSEVVQYLLCLYIRMNVMNLKINNFFFKFIRIFCFYELTEHSQSLFSGNTMRYQPSLLLYYVNDKTNTRKNDFFKLSTIYVYNQ